MKKQIQIKQTQINKACFQHDIANDNFKDFPGRTASDKALYTKAFEIFSNLKYDKCQRNFTSMVKFLMKVPSSDKSSFYC